MSISEELQLIIRAIGAEKAGKSVKSLMKSYVDIRFAVTDAAKVASALFDASKKGAQAMRTESAFKVMIKDADEMMLKMNSAANETISSMNLMQTANRAAALGIAEADIPKLLEIAAASAKQMGTETDAAFSDIVTGIARSSPLILDNLGFIMKGMGATADKSKIMAAIFKQGNERIKTMADQVGDTKDQLDQASTTFKNLSDAIQKGTAQKMAPAFASLSEWTAKWADALLGIETQQRRTAVMDVQRQIRDLEKQRFEYAQRIKQTYTWLGFLQNKSNEEVEVQVGKLQKQDRLLLDRIRKLKKEVELTLKIEAIKDKPKTKFKKDEETKKTEADLLRQGKQAEIEILRNTNMLIEAIELEKQERLRQIQEKYGQLTGLEMLTARRQMEIAVEQDAANQVIEIRKKLADETEEQEKKMRDAREQSVNSTLMVAGAIKGGLADLAAVAGMSRKELALIEIPWEIAQGAAKLAAGTWPPNPAAIAAASGHFLAAVKYGVVAGKAVDTGASRGGGLGGGGAQTTQSQNVTITVNGGGVPVDTEGARAMWEAITHNQILPAIQQTRNMQ